MRQRERGSSHSDDKLKKEPGSDLFSPFPLFVAGCLCLCSPVLSCYLSKLLIGPLFDLLEESYL